MPFTVIKSAIMIQISGGKRHAHVDAFLRLISRASTSFIGASQYPSTSSREAMIMDKEERRSDPRQASAFRLTLP
jgi:hypothetical protein